MSESSANSTGVSSTGVGDGGNANTQATVDSNKSTAKVVDNKTAETTEKAEKATNRDMFRGRIKKHFPDSDHSDNETFYKDANSRYGEMSDYMKKNQAINKNMIDTFNSNPEVAGFMRDIMKNVPAEIAAARNFDTTGWGKDDDGTDKPEWKEAGEKRMQKIKDKEAYLKTIDDNIALTKKEVDSFKTENNLSDDDALVFLGEVDKFISEAITGKFTKATLSRLYRSITADSEIKAAEVAGRNQSIEAKKAIQNNKQGDGIPNLQTTTTDKPELKERKQSRWEDAVDETVRKRSR